MEQVKFHCINCDKHVALPRHITHKDFVGRHKVCMYCGYSNKHHTFKNISEFKEAEHKHHDYCHHCRTRREHIKVDGFMLCKHCGNQSVDYTGKMLKF